MLSSEVEREVSGDSTGVYTSMTNDRGRGYNSVFRKDGRNHYIREEVIAYLGMQYAD